MSRVLPVVAGAVSAYVLLALAVLWVRTQCLPISSNEIKWQCAAAVWAVAVAYLTGAFVAAYAARSALVAAAVFVLVLPGHMYLPDLGLVSFGRAWYLNPNALLFALLPAMAGAALARLTPWRPSR